MTYFSDIQVQNLETVLFADQFSGSDIGAQINNAIAALPTVVDPASGNSYACGIVTLVGFAGQTVTQSTTVNINSPFISIIGPGSGSLQINSNINGDAFRITLGSTFTVSQAGKIAGFYLNGNSSSSAVGIHYGDIIGLTFEDLVISNFTGTNSVALWCDNSTQFTERTLILKVHLNGNTVGWQFTNTANSANSISMGYNKCLDMRLNVNNNQIGILQKHLNSYDTLIYHGVFNINANFSGASKTFIEQQNSTFRGNQIAIFTEDNGAGGIWLQNDSTSIFDFYGSINHSQGSAPMTNSISGQFQQQWGNFIPGNSTTFTTGGMNSPIPDTPATSSQNINSQPFSIQGNYWDGSQSAQCGITQQVTFVSGTNPVMEFNLTKALGTLFTVFNCSSLEAVFFQNLQLMAPALSSSGSNLSLGNATAGSATAGSATLPANPVGFLEFYIGSTLYKLPYYHS